MVLILANKTRYMHKSLYHRTSPTSHYRKNSNIIRTISTKNRGLVAGVRIISLGCVLYKCAHCIRIFTVHRFNFIDHMIRSVTSSSTRRKCRLGEHGSFSTGRRPLIHMKETIKLLCVHRPGKSYS